MRLYITGGSGYLGSYLRTMAQLNGWHVRYSVHQTAPSADADIVDLRRRGQLTAAIRAFAPHAVIHTAYRQHDPDLHAITVLGAIEAAAASAIVAARHIHLSSDMVFAGTASEYDEIDAPNPIVPYGFAKAVAEAGVAQAHPEASIVRTSLIYSPPQQPPGRHEQIALAAANGTNPMNFFHDEIRCPVLVDELAQALLILIGQPHRGPLHLVGRDAVSRFEFAQRVVRARGGNPVTLKSATLANMHPPRPARLVLRSTYPNPAWQLRGVRTVLPD